MSEQPQSTESPLVSDDARCQFPIGPGGQVCGDPVPRSGEPGRPASYCANPAHTRAKAFAARRAFDRAAAGGGHAGQAALQAEVDVLRDRPVTDGRQSFGVLLTRFEEAAEQAQRAAATQQAQLTAILERATEVVRTVSDPDAAGYEVEQIKRERDVRVAEAQTAQAGAEQAARSARKKAQDEAELRAQADEAAEQALREVEAIRTETAATIARITAETEATVTEHQTRAEQAAAGERVAREELERVRVEAAAAVTTAQAGAEQHKQQTIADRDRVLADREADMHEQIQDAKAKADELVDTAQREAAAKVEAAQQTATEQVAAAARAAEQAKTEASALVKAAQHELAEAVTAKTRAESDQAAAERRAAEDRATVERLRAELDQQRADYRQELAAVRKDAAEERTALRKEAAEQLAAVLATVQQATGRSEAGEAGTAEAPAQQTRRGRAKGEQ